MQARRDDGDTVTLTGLKVKTLEQLLVYAIGGMKLKLGDQLIESSSLYKLCTDMVRLLADSNVRIMELPDEQILPTVQEVKPVVQVSQDGPHA